MRETYSKRGHVIKKWICVCQGGFIDELWWTRQWITDSRKKLEISWVTKRLPDRPTKEGLCSMY